jgi:hypothetical protein
MYFPGSSIAVSKYKAYFLDFLKKEYFYSKNDDICMIRQNKLTHLQKFIILHLSNQLSGILNERKFKESLYIFIFGINYSQ